MDVNNILITSIKENKMPHEFTDIEYIKKIVMTSFLQQIIMFS